MGFFPGKHGGAMVLLLLSACPKGRVGDSGECAASASECLPTGCHLLVRSDLVFWPC